MMSRFSFTAALGLVGYSLIGCGPGTELVRLNPAELEVSTQRLEFGFVEKGDRQEKDLVISNPGDVDLGIKDIFLASSVNPERGHEGSFQLIYSCRDIVVPDLNGDTDASESARERADIDSGDTGDSGKDTTIDTGEPVDTGDCRLPAGGRLRVKVRFTPERAFDNWDSIIIETYGEELSAQDLATTPVDEILYRDLDTTWRQVYLHGEGGETRPRALVTPRTVNFGYVFDGQTESRFISIRNDGDGELMVAGVDIARDSCPGFEIVSRPDDDVPISGAQSKVIEASFSPVTDRAAQCKLEVEVYDPAEPTELEVIDVLMVANNGTNTVNVPPRVVIHSPAPGYQHKGLDPLPLELTVYDANEPASGLYCKVRSNLQGIKDSRPALADCRPPESSPSGHVIVNVPVDFYVEPGLDVWLVRVTDSSGVTREASVPVLLNAAYPASDDDGDGFGTDSEPRDCDDTNAYIYPESAEMHDGRDNDCDRLIDEGTDGFDDDGDGMTEVQGDCDDANTYTYKGAPERRDKADNDCDGIADENTADYDDDGDGYTELDQDCDDANPLVHPGADELCDDGIDNDCDRQTDDGDEDGCVATLSEPMVIGRIDLARTAIELGDTVQAFVQVYEEDGDNITYEWEVEGGAGQIDDPAAPTINWTAPSELSNPDNIGDIYTLYVVAGDDDGNQDWDFQTIWAYPRGDLEVNLVKEVEVEGGCSTVPVAPLGLFAGLGLLFAGLRRRRD